MRTQQVRRRSTALLATTGALGEEYATYATATPPGSLPAPLLAAVLAVASLVDRFRRSRGEERAQLEWFTSAGLMLLLVRPTRASPWLRP